MYLIQSMIFMSSKIILDSSVLIEYAKNSRPELFEALLIQEKLNLCYGLPIVSEYLFHYLAIAGNKSPLTLKMNNQIGNILSVGHPMDIFRPLSFLSDSVEMVEEAFYLMQQYNLLSNDALILALCKQHDVKYLASFDADFVTACVGEGIRLVQSAKDCSTLD